MPLIYMIYKKIAIDINFKTHPTCLVCPDKMKIREPVFDLSQEINEINLSMRLIEFSVYKQKILGGNKVSPMLMMK